MSEEWTEDGKTLEKISTIAENSYKSSKDSVETGLVFSSNHSAHKLPGEEADQSEDTDLEIDKDYSLGIKRSGSHYDSSGRQAYLGACKLYCQIPASYFMKNGDKEEFKMRHHQLGATGIKPIAVSLVSNTAIEKFDIEDNGIGDHGCTYIAEMLKENYFITDLNLANNCIGAQGAAALFQVLKISDSMIKLNISGNPIGDRAAHIIGESISENIKIQILLMSKCDLGENTSIELSGMMMNNITLKELDLSSNHIRTIGMQAILRGMAKNTSIRNLNLSKNGISLEGCLELGKMIKDNRALRILNISECGIHLNGTVLIARSIKINNTLQVLHMDNNLFLYDGCKVMLELISTSFTRLRYLSFGRIRMKNDLQQIQNTVEKDKHILISHGGMLEDFSQVKKTSEFQPLNNAFNFLTTDEQKLLRSQLDSWTEANNEVEDPEYIMLKDLKKVLDLNSDWSIRKEEMMRRAKRSVRYGRIHYKILPN